MTFDESAAVEAMARALAWESLTPLGRGRCEWLKDYSECEREKYRAQAQAALSALRPFLGDRWRTMESAPKDGTPILLFARHINATAPVRVVGHYNGEEFGWIAVSFVPHGPMQIVPRAWQPLPDFPPDGGKEA